MPQVVPDTSIHEALQSAVSMQRQAVDWLETNAASMCDSEIGQAHLYRLPYALSAAGHRAAAVRAFDMIAGSVLAPDGDLRAGPLRRRFTHRWASYPLTVLATAAWVLDRAELARTILATVAERFVDREHGGALGERPEDRSSRRQDLFPTAQMGIAALMAGDRSLAASAARWVERLVEQQWSPSKAFYLSTEEDALIVDDPGRPDEAGSPIVFAERHQPIASLGIGAAFLADTGGTFGRPDLVPLAEHLHGLYGRVDPGAYGMGESTQMCKRAWGACSLYRTTRDPRYMEDLIEMTGWFDSGFSPEGHWRAPARLEPGTGAPRVVIDAEITAEFVQHLSLVISTLQATEGDDPS